MHSHRSSDPEILRLQKFTLLYQFSVAQYLTYGCTDAVYLGIFGDPPREVGGTGRGESILTSLVGSPGLVPCWKVSCFFTEWAGTRLDLTGAWGCRRVKGGACSYGSFLTRKDP